MRRITVALASGLLFAGAFVGSALPAAASHGTPGCPGEGAVIQAQARTRAELVAAAREGAQATGSNFGEVQSTYNGTACGHGQPHP